VVIQEKRVKKKPQMQLVLFLKKKTRKNSIWKLDARGFLANAIVFPRIFQSFPPSRFEPWTIDNDRRIVPGYFQYPHEFHESPVNHHQIP
jgi:hypothetical protein